MCKKIDREKENKRLHEKKKEESGWKRGEGAGKGSEIPGARAKELETGKTSSSSF